MRNNQSLEDALYAWAANEQKTLHLGYPSTAAGFSEYQSGYRISSRVPAQSELDIMGLVEKGISRMRVWSDRRPIECLTEYYGAYPDAPPREVRLSELKKKYRKGNIDVALKEAKRYLEGIVDIYVGSK